MKKILLIIALTTTTACTKQALDPAAPTANHTISFATQLTQTKGEAKEEFVPADQFFVYGVNTEDVDFNAQAPNGANYVFDAQPLGGISVTNYGKNTDGTDNWQYGNPVVWMPGKSTFFAFSPVPHATQNYGITQQPAKIALNSIPKIEFTVEGGYDPATATPQEIADSKAWNKKQVDLMVAYAANQASGQITTLTFQHTLSRITFAVRPMQATGYLRINSVTLRNVQTQASLKLTGEWEKQTLARPRDFSLTLKNDAVNMIPATPDKTYAINEGQETLCMIPQPLNGITLEIRYSYSPDGNTWPDYMDGKLIQTDLATISSVWTDATRYNYIITIDPQKHTTKLTAI